MSHFNSSSSSSTNVPRPPPPIGTVRSTSGRPSGDNAELLVRVSKLRHEVAELRAQSSLMLPPPDETYPHSNFQKTQEYGQGVQQYEKSASITARDVEENKRRIVAASTISRMESAESERKALLDFLQGDMGNTAVLARRLELLEDELEVAQHAQALATQRMAEAESAVLRERATTTNQDQQILAYQKSLDEVTVHNDLLRKDKLQLEHQLPLLREEIGQLRNQLRAANEHLGVAQPRLQQLEPEILRLRREKSDWSLERSHLTDELNRLSPLAQLLGEVETEFVNKSFVTIDSVPSVSSWSVGPELRRLSPRLYDYMRLMSQSNYRKEAECTEAIELRARAERELAAYTEEAERKMAEYRVLLEKHENTIESLAHQIALYERELPDGQQAQVIVTQIRSTLSSFPGGLKGLFQAISFDTDLAAATASAATSRSGYMQPGDIRTYGYEKQWKSQNSSRTDVFGGDASQSQSQSQAQRQNSKKFGNAEDKTKLSADLVRDEQLPLVIGKALAYNFNAVSGLKETKLLLEQREIAIKSLRDELKQVSKRCDSRKDLINELRGSMSRMSESQRSQEEKLKSNLETAAELVENQNMFVLMLEAKLEESKSIIISLRKQLDAKDRSDTSLQNKLWRLLMESGNSPPHLDSTSIAELLDYIASALMLGRRISDDYKPKTVMKKTPTKPSSSSLSSSTTPGTPSVELYENISHFLLSPQQKNNSSLDDALPLHESFHYSRGRQEATNAQSTNASNDFRSRLMRASQTLQSLRE